MQTATSFTGELVESAASYNVILRTLWNSAIRDRASLLQYLIHTYHYLKASVPLMQAALDQSGKLGFTDYSHYLERHIDEERDHDVWLLEDLCGLGVPEEMVVGTSPNRAVVGMVGKAYYTIFHSDVRAFLGYVFALESAPPGEAFIHTLETRCDLPVGSLRTLRLHAEEDKSHRVELLRIIGEVVSEPRTQTLTSELALDTLANLGVFLGELRTV